MAILDFPQDTSQSPYVANGVTYEWDGQKWTASIGGGSVSVHVGTNPPTGTPSQGDLWWQDEEARLYVYYTDDDSSQWVDASPGAGGSGGGGGGIAGITIQDQGVNSNQDATTLNFVGAGVDVTGDGSTTKTITITGGGGSGSVPSLNQVTAVGNMSDLPIEVGDYDPDNPNPVGSVWLNLYNNRGSVAVQAADGHDTESAFHVQNKNNGVFDIKYDGSVNAARGLISLNADGQIWSKESITVFTDDTTGVSYSVNSSAGDNAKFAVFGDGKTEIGGTIPGSANITLNASGSATFDKRVECGTSLQLPDTTPANGIYVGQGGSGATGWNARITGDGSAYFGGNESAGANITLSASGSAEFSGYVKIDRDIAASETALLIQTENDSGRVFEVATSGTTRIGGTMPAAPNITLNANGRIETVFDGKFRLGVGETGASGSTNSFGQVAHTFNGFDGYTTYSDPDGNETARITCTDGSADFGVTAGFTAGTRSNPDSFTLYTNDSPGNASRFIVYNAQEAANTGSTGYKYIIEPSGTVKLGGDAFNTLTIALNSVGSIVSERATNGVSLRLGVQGTAPGCEITSEGDATFGTLNTASAAGKGVGIYGKNGAVYAQRASNEGSLAVWTGWEGDTPTSSINANGGSSFNGRMDVGSNSLDEVALKLQSNHTSNSATLYVQQHAAGKKLFSGVDATNQEKVMFDVDGNADFQGDVTTTGTVNGVNVANVGAALTSLKTAAASASDLDALKAAIASALANF